MCFHSFCRQNKQKKKPNGNFSQLFSSPGIKFHFKMQVIMKPPSVTGNSQMGKSSLYENTSTDTTRVHDSVGTVILRFPAKRGHTLLHTKVSGGAGAARQQLRATSPRSSCCGGGGRWSPLPGPVAFRLGREEAADSLLPLFYSASQRLLEHSSHIASASHSD